jgi:hypothetical protein
LQQNNFQRERYILDIEILFGNVAEPHPYISAFSKEKKVIFNYKTHQLCSHAVQVLDGISNEFSEQCSHDLPSKQYE